MTLYPCVYVLLTLPLSAGRMWSYAHGGKPYSDAYACVAGSLITSCGWVDSLLYTLTRRRLLQDTMPGNGGRRSAADGSLGITHTRTVTVEGGHAYDGVELKAQEGRMNGRDYGRSQSPASSMCPILGNRTYPNGKSTGFRAMVEEDRLEKERVEEEKEKEDELSELPIEMPAVLPPSWVHYHQ